MLANPPRHAGWMTRDGHRLSHTEARGTMTCPESDLKYRELQKNYLKCLDLEQEDPLAANHSVGKVSYRSAAAGRS
jgi:UDP-2-acetamido-3-amino-2,3-dideoxy-glucuronate N-acetyltransferase